MNNKRFLLISTIVPFLFFTSCNNKRNGNILKKEYYPNGNLKTEITYSNDTLKNGSAISYYPNGLVWQKLNYRNGALDSIYIEYFENTKVKEQGMYSNGTPMGSFFYYYKNGALKAYNAKDYTGETYYVIRFDSLGNKIYQDGVNIARNAIDFNKKSTFKINDTFHFAWSIAEPPRYMHEVKIGVRKKNESTDGSSKYLQIKPFEHYPFNRSIVDYKSAFQDVGYYQIIIASKLVDTSTHNYNVDTSIIDVTVK